MHYHDSKEVNEWFVYKDFLLNQKIFNYTIVLYVRGT